MRPKLNRCCISQVQSIPLFFVFLYESLLAECNISYSCLQRTSGIEWNDLVMLQETQTFPFVEDERWKPLPKTFSSNGAVVSGPESPRRDFTLSELLDWLTAKSPCLCNILIIVLTNNDKNACL